MVTGNRIALTCLVVVTLAGCASVNAPCPKETLDALLNRKLPVDEVSVPPLPEREVAMAVHVLVNELRVSHGLASFSWDESLARVATLHSEDMARRSFFDHVNPDGDDPTDRAQKLGVPHTRVDENQIVNGVGENIFLGDRFTEYRTYRLADGTVRCDIEWMSPEQIAQRVVDDWFESKSHRANLLSPLYRSHGVGVAAGPNGTVFMTQNLSPVEARVKPLAMVERRGD